MARNLAPKGGGPILLFQWEIWPRSPGITRRLLLSPSPGVPDVVPALADTMKCCYVPLPGCSVQGVNPKIHLVMGRGAASALSGALDKTLDEKESLLPFD